MPAGYSNSGLAFSGPREETDGSYFGPWPDISRPMDHRKWREVNRAVAGFIESLAPGDREHLRVLALDIARGIRSLDPLYDKFCVFSYPRCQDVCCRWATVFYHITDLLFIHALGEKPPPHQTRTSSGGPCLYLGHEGCSLSRVRRPYRCTWYMCELHVECLDSEPPRVQRRVFKTMEEIRRSKELLADFFRRMPAR